jgi:hypothetical protein
MNNNIPYIHNYCDRWCERCFFTRNCAVFFEVDGLSDDEKDVNNKAFWERLSRNFQNTMAFLHESAEKHGIHLDEITSEEINDVQQQLERTDKLVRKNPLIIYAQQYSDLVLKLLEDEQYWREKAGSIIRDAGLGILNEKEAREKAEQVKDCQDVLGWYMFFIQVKFTRALSGKIEDDDAAGLQSDANGSAKVAMMAVERSKHSSAQLFELFKEEDRYLPVLSLLNKIEKLGSMEFPNGMLFIRPGFDEQ